ncbi:MAG TPA: tetratricopeptide repeat protein [bacterium]|nr:tetratricopeptide repeat protein [bacterium]
MQATRKPSSERTQTGIKRGSGRPKPWLVFGAAALAALLLYLPTLQYGFVWDDGPLILNNPSLDRTSPVGIFTQGFWNNPEADTSEGNTAAYYRPLSNLSLYVDRKVWGLRPSGYHLTNVIVNAAVVLLTCLLLWELFGSVWPAVLGGLLVGIHPAMNCVVTFISNRTYLLALFFLLTGSYALLRGRRDRRRAWPVLFGVSLLLSTLALEASLVFAVIAAAWVLANRTRYRGRWWWAAAVALPITLYLLLRFSVARVPLQSSAMSPAISYPLLVANAFGQQLQLLLFPFNQKVIYLPARPFTSFSWYTILGLLFLGLPLYAVVRLGHRRRRTEVGGMQNLRADPGAIRLGWYGYAWMVLFLLPFAYMVFLGPAGRALYLTAPGVMILLAALYRTPDRRQSTNRVVLGVVLLYAAACAVQTLRRNPVWHDDLSLSRTMVQEAPRSSGGHLNYGLALARTGRKEEAIEQYQIAINIKPDYVEPHLTLAFALIDQGDLPDAIRELREVVRLSPESPKARNDLAVTLMRNGQLDSAIVEYKEVLRLDPNSDLTLNNLGYAYMQSGDFRQAITCLKAALQLKPDFAGARANLAAAYRAAGMPDSAALLEGNQR